MLGALQSQSLEKIKSICSIVHVAFLTQQSPHKPYCKNLPNMSSTGAQLPLVYKQATSCLDGSKWTSSIANPICQKGQRKTLPDFCIFFPMFLLFPAIFFTFSLFFPSPCQFLAIFCWGGERYFAPLVTPSSLAILQKWTIYTLQNHLPTTTSLTSLQMSSLDDSCTMVTTSLLWIP